MDLSLILWMLASVFIVAVVLIAWKARKAAALDRGEQASESRDPQASEAVEPVFEEKPCEPKDILPPGEPGESEERREPSAPPDAAVPTPPPEVPPPAGPAPAKGGEVEDAQVEQKAERRERIARLQAGLKTTRQGLVVRIGRLFKEKKEVAQATIDELEEILITSDVGVKTTEMMIAWVKDHFMKSDAARPSDSTDLSDHFQDLLQAKIQEILSVDAPAWDVSRAKPFCIMMVGVNGTGKTTTIGKLASQIKASGASVLLAAGDTFRAAAVAQLEIWARRVGCDVVQGPEGADPSSVIFDAIRKARDEGVDVVIADTAGRLHTKVPLMDEIKKIRRVMDKAMPGAPHEVLLVLDATTGQNALSQAKMFKEALDITGLVLSKMDGTAKGGVIIGIVHELGIPVRFIGIGEKVDDLRLFDPAEFSEALVQGDRDSEEKAA